MADQTKEDDGISAKRRDVLLLRLLKTPPQPRPKREREKATKPSSGDGRRHKSKKSAN